MRGTGTAAVAVAALYLAGCGGTKEDVATTASHGGSTASAPVPMLTREDIAQQPRGSARAAVMNLLYWAQWGNWPEVLAGYEPSIRRAIGSTRIVGTYQQQRGALMTTRFSVGATVPTSAGYFVAVRFDPAQGGPTPQSYLLARRGGRWRIVHDTFLEGAYPSYIQALVQSHVAPNAKRPARSALSAASAASERLRAALVTPPRRRR